MMMKKMMIKMMMFMMVIMMMKMMMKGKTVSSVGPSAPRFLNICAILPVSNVSTHRFRFYLCAPLLPVETVFPELDDHDDDHDDEGYDDGENCFQRGAFGPTLLKYLCYTTSK